MDRGTKNSFAGKFYCYLLLHFEEYTFPNEAITREKEIKDWRRSKKEELIGQNNKNWKFLNSELLDWPPEPRDLYHRGR
jgi:putative endonuclease